MLHFVSLVILELLLVLGFHKKTSQNIREKAIHYHCRMYCPDYVASELGS